MKLLGFLALILSVPQANPQQAPALRPSGIAARINGEIITWDEVELMIRNVPMADRTPEVRRQMLKALADRTLFLQEAKNYSIDVTEAQVDVVLESRRKHSGMSVEDFQKYVNNNEGLSITEYRRLLKQELTINTLMSRLATEPLRSPNTKLKLLLEFVSPEEMRDYYEKHPEQFTEIRQMDLVFLAFQFQTPEERDAKVRLAESIRRRVKEGASLYVLSLAYMDVNLMVGKDRMRTPVYENLSYKDSPFPKKISDFLFSEEKEGGLKEGAVSEPIVEGNRVNLFQPQRRIIEKARTFEEAQPLIRRHLESAKRRENLRILRDDLVRRSFVEPADIFN